MNAPDVKPQLDYDRSTTGPTRRQFRLLLILTFVNTLFLGWYVAGPQAAQFFRSQWDQWQARRAQREQTRKFLADQQKCLEHAFPPDLVIYEEDAATAKRLITQRPDYRGQAITNRPTLQNWPLAAVFDKQPDGWKEVASAAGESFNQSWLPFVFLGERTTPTGQRRLLIIQLAPSPAANDNPGDDGIVATSDPRRQLFVRIFKPAVAGEAPSVLHDTSLDIHSPPSEAIVNPQTGEWKPRRSFALRVLAGQADPGDRSHVILPFQLNGQPGAIDVYLKDDGVVFKPRMGVLTVDAGQLSVDLSPSSSSTTAPTTAF